jgi:hypothetical protein
LFDRREMQTELNVSHAHLTYNNAPREARTPDLEVNSLTL